MAAMTNNIQLTCIDGTNGVALFAAGSGVSVSHQGQTTGEITEADLRAIALTDGQHAGAAIADRVIGLIPIVLNDASLRTLIGEADRWADEHYH